MGADAGCARYQVTWICQLNFTKIGVEAQESIYIYRQLQDPTRK